MPLVIVKMHAGRTPEQKEALVEALAKTMQDTLGVSQKSLTIDVQDVPKEQWAEKVRAVDIEPRKDEILYLDGEKQ